MPLSTQSLLVVDNDASDAEATARCLEKAGYHVSVTLSGVDALDLVLSRSFAAVVLEFRLEGLGGLTFIQKVHERKPMLPVILLTKHGDSRTAITAVKSGAFDVLHKPLDADELLSTLEEAVTFSRRMAKPVEIGNIYEDQDTLIGKSRAMTKVYRELGRLSATPVTVLIRGETGTGKELIARALYQHGHRALKPFVAVNCAAIPEQLLESELFGHEKGAFTGASSTRIGRFEYAHNATLFLDEIGDMNLALQAKLLRVLQERRIQRCRRAGGRSRRCPPDHRDASGSGTDGFRRHVPGGPFLSPQRGRHRRAGAARAP